MVRRVLVIVGLFLVGALAAARDSKVELAREILLAFEASKQPGVSEEVRERYFAYLAEDATEFHDVYHVRLEGKERLRRTRAFLAFDLEIHDIAAGDSFAIAKLTTYSRYLKDGEEKEHRGRQTVVFEFNEEGLVHHIRRYLD